MGDPFVSYADGNERHSIAIPSLSPSPDFARLEADLFRV